MVAFKAMDIIDANSVPVFKLCVLQIHLSTVNIYG